MTADHDKYGSRPGWWCDECATGGFDLPHDEIEREIGEHNSRWHRDTYDDDRKFEKERTL